MPYRPITRPVVLTLSAEEAEAVRLTARAANIAAPSGGRALLVSDARLETLRAIGARLERLADARTPEILDTLRRICAALELYPHWQPSMAAALAAEGRIALMIAEGRS